MVQTDTLQVVAQSCEHGRRPAPRSTWQPEMNGATAQADKQEAVQAVEPSQQWDYMNLT